jgi:hypothetical protein
MVHLGHAPAGRLDGMHGGEISLDDFHRFTKERLRLAGRAAKQPHAGSRFEQLPDQVAPDEPSASSDENGGGDRHV